MPRPRVSSIPSKVVPTWDNDDDPPSLLGDLEFDRTESPVHTGRRDNAPVDDRGTPPLSPLQTFRSTETVGLGEDESELLIHDKRARDPLMRNSGASGFPVGSARVYGLPPISSKTVCQSTPYSNNAAPFGSSSVDGGRPIPSDSWQGELDPPHSTSALTSTARVPALPTRSSVDDARGVTVGMQGNENKSLGLNSAVSGLEATAIGETEEGNGDENDVPGAYGGRGGDEFTTVKPVSSLPQGGPTTRKTSCAEKRNEDMSVEINSLSKVRHVTRQ